MAIFTTGSNLRAKNRSLVFLTVEHIQQTLESVSWAGKHTIFSPSEGGSTWMECVHHLRQCSLANRTCREKGKNNQKWDFHIQSHHGHCSNLQVPNVAEYMKWPYESTHMHRERTGVLTCTESVQEYSHAAVRNPLASNCLVNSRTSRQHGDTDTGSPACASSWSASSCAWHTSDSGYCSAAMCERMPGKPKNIQLTSQLW